MNFIAKALAIRTIELALSVRLVPGVGDSLLPLTARQEAGKEQDQVFHGFTVGRFFPRRPARNPATTPPRVEPIQVH